MFDKNLNKYFNEKNNIPFVVDMLNLGDNSTDLIKVDKNENENLLKDVFEIDNQYKFITNENILDSFKKYSMIIMLFIHLTKNRKTYMLNTY